MGAQDCTPARQAIGYSHHFDPESGWCIHGCGVRADGRIINASGSVVRDGRDYSPDQLYDRTFGDDR